MNTTVSFEIAKLLKEKGFDEPCRYVHDTWNNVKDWLEDGEGEHRNSHQNRSVYYSAPTIAEVVVWLYEKHGLWIVVNVNIMGSWYFEHFDLKEKRNAQFKPTDTHYDSPTEAYEAVIEYTLKNLI